MFFVAVEDKFAKIGKNCLYKPFFFLLLKFVFMLFHINSSNVYSSKLSIILTPDGALWSQSCLHPASNFSLASNIHPKLYYTLVFLTTVNLNFGDIVVF